MKAHIFNIAGVDSAVVEREVYAMMEREYPQLWKVCYPRIYHDPRSGQYYSSKLPARQMMTIAQKMMAGTVDASEKYEFHLASHLSKFRMPMFWLSPSMAQAIKLTAPPGKFNWYEMPLPFDAGIFMMPKGSLVHPTDGDASFICYARFRAGVEYRAPLIPSIPYTSFNGSMILAAAVESGYFIHWNIPLNFYGPMITLPELQDLIQRHSCNEHRTAVPLRDGGMKPGDHALGLDVAHYVLSTLMLMTARPDLVTGSSLSHRLPAKKSREPKEFWNPAIIGEHYKVRHEARPSQGGTHSSPRFHWVKGFLRDHSYGPGRTQHKTLWIEPYTRGGGE
jgi:hypothetical protein